MNAKAFENEVLEYITGKKADDFEVINLKDEESECGFRRVTLYCNIHNIIENSEMFVLEIDFEYNASTKEVDVNKALLTVKLCEEKIIRINRDLPLVHFVVYKWLYTNT